MHTDCCRCRLELSPRHRRGPLLHRSAIKRPPSDSGYGIREPETPATRWGFPVPLNHGVYSSSDTV
nr:MAG TPA: hypothetical protein [Caudoviricetes sp.]